MDLGGSLSKAWSIVETNGDSDKYSEYIALSHRWTASTPKLLRCNEVDFNTRVHKDSKLPRDYRDVIRLCRALSVRYRWIDSLCILQDSEDDFDREAPKMMDVYRNARLTVSICWNAPEAPISRKRNRRAFPRPPPKETEGKQIVICALLHFFLFLCSLNTYTYLFMLAADCFLECPPRPAPGQKDHVFVKYVGSDEEWSKCVLDAPINQRGWVLQERILSQRILYLGNDQLYWECDYLMACEAEPSRPIRYGCRESIHVGSLECHEKLLSRLDYLRLLSWPRLIETYSSTGLTYEKDRPFAISGVARYCSLATGWRYLAGIWIDYWHFDLVWYYHDVLGWNQLPQACGHLGACSCRHVAVDVPSWSWAASPMTRRITWGTDSRAEFETSRINTFDSPSVKPLAVLSGTSGTGDVVSHFEGASLNIRCLLTPTKLKKEFLKDLHLEPWKDAPQRASADDCLGGPCDGPRWDGLCPLETRSGPESVGDPGVNVYLSRRHHPSRQCYIAPLFRHRRHGDDEICGLVIQEERALRGSSSQHGTQRFIRIGVFTSKDGASQPRFTQLIMNTILKQQKLGQNPEAGEETNLGATELFESRLREYAMAKMSAPTGGSGVEYHSSLGYFNAKWGEICLV
ncbi:hypothetical protein ACJ41O_010268 [Fusarium nematophilum]